MSERLLDKMEEGGTTSSGCTATLHKGEKPLFPLSQKTTGEVPFSLSKYVQIPYTINRYLRDYQREGAKFIFDNYVKSRGCILGDDMGLGKTIQVRMSALLLSVVASDIQVLWSW